MKKDIIETTLEQAIQKWEKKKAYWHELNQMNGMKQNMELQKKYIEDLNTEPDPAKRLKIIEKHEKDSKAIEQKIKKELQFNKIYKGLDEATSNLTNLNYHLQSYQHDKRLKQMLREARDKS